MSTTITRDEWLAEFERAMQNAANGDGMTVREIAAQMKLSEERCRLLLRRIQPRLIASRKLWTGIDGRHTTVPCYRLKPEE